MTAVAHEPDPQYLTTKEVSKETRIASDTLRQWRTRGLGPQWFRLGSRVFYARTDVDAWIAQAREATRGTTLAPAV